uniref:Putative secreted protein n=1 Tax=Anopheles darlingi TaxID=43151 RepID=A0A2M4D6Y3_ANODA
MSQPHTWSATSLCLWLPHSSRLDCCKASRNHKVSLMHKQVCIEAKHTFLIIRTVFRYFLQFYINTEKNPLNTPTVIPTPLDTAQTNRRVLSPNHSHPQKTITRRR